MCMINLLKKLTLIFVKKVNTDTRSLVKKANYNSKVKKNKKIAIAKKLLIMFIITSILIHNNLKS